MFTLNNVVFQVFPADVEKLRPIGEYTLSRFIKELIEPPKTLEGTINKIRSYPNDKAMRDYIKRNEMYYFTPSVVLNPHGRRSYKDIIRFNPVAIIEFDNISIEYAMYLKNTIFYNYPECIVAWVGPSGNGAKFMFRIPTVGSVEEYKEYWFGLAYIFQDVFGFDDSNQNCVLPLFVSLDRDALFRRKPQEFTQKGYREDSFVSIPEGERIVGENISPNEHLDAYSRVRRMFENIVGNGHPQVIRYSLVAGGFYSYGYGDKNGWLELLEECIRSNEYLTSGGEGKTRGYVNTSRQSFTKGQGSPLSLR